MAITPIFTKRVFWVAGIYGLIALLPQYFLEARPNHGFPPPITHPGYFYGFAGVALAWQVVFLSIARDVSRHCLLVLPAILEKITLGGAAVVLSLQSRARPLH